MSGRRLRGTRETEVGQGLAQALGLTEGSVLALALPSGAELRLRVVGIVSSLQHDGRVAYVITCMGPSNTFDTNAEGPIVTLMRAKAQDLSSRMGYRTKKAG